MRRRVWVIGVLLILGALLFGVVLGEKDIGSRAVNAAKVQLTGRLPLQSWGLYSPASFRPMDGAWYFDSRSFEEQEEGKRVSELGHLISYEGLPGVKAIELELGLFPPLASPFLVEYDEIDFWLVVEVVYLDLDNQVTQREYTISASELAGGSAKLSGQWRLDKLETSPMMGVQTTVRLTISPPPGKLYYVYLRAEGDSLDRVGGLYIQRAELILR